MGCISDITFICIYLLMYLFLIHRVHFLTYRGCHLGDHECYFFLRVYFVNIYEYINIYQYVWLGCRLYKSHYIGLARCFPLVHHSVYWFGTQTITLFVYVIFKGDFSPCPLFENILF